MCNAGCTAKLNSATSTLAENGRMNWLRDANRRFLRTGQVLCQWQPTAIIYYAVCAMVLGWGAFQRFHLPLLAGGGRRHMGLFKPCPIETDRWRVSTCRRKKFRLSRVLVPRSGD